MISKKFICRKTVLIISFLLFILSHNVNAQVSSGINPTNLSTVKIDELSDAEVLSIIQQGEASGLTIEQAQAMAAKRGLPSSEMQKLKDRMAKIQNAKGTAGTGNVENEVANKSNEKAKEATIITGKILDAGGSAKGASANIYGQEYFRNGDIKIFDKSSDAKAASNYVIGIGDELGISVFGYSYYNEALKVDSRGAINPNQVGPIFIKGLTFEKAKSLIRTKLNQYYDLSNNKLEITLAYSRSITVNIVGEVSNPGSYKIPAINTAFNALILAGGPSDIGTLRNIQIRRDGKLIKTLDVYTFLNDPNSKQDFYLEDNDYIVVPSSQKVVKISGEVKRQNKFELKQDETLNDLIKLSGGLNSNAYLKSIHIKRIDKMNMKFIDVNYEALLKSKAEFALQNGDEILIVPVLAELKNTVSISGNVNFPSFYNLLEGEKLTDLIAKAGGVKFGTVVERAYLTRKNLDNTTEILLVDLKEILANPASKSNYILKDNDILGVYSYAAFTDESKVEISGSIRTEGEFKYQSGMTLGDLLFLAGGLKFYGNNLRVEISRMSIFAPDYVEGAPAKILSYKLQIPRNNFDTSAALSYKLLPFDKVYIRNIVDFTYQKTVTLNGEVKYPGEYTLLHKDERIDDLVKRAGGLTKFAFPESASISRPTLRGENLVMNLKSALKSHNNKYNYVLKEGDVLTVPTVNDYVAIVGSSIEYLTVLNKEQVNAPYVNGRRARYYVNEFGNGFTKNAWRKKTYVVQPSAKINKTINLLVFNIYPKVTKGSTIYVVEKPVKNKKEKDPNAKPVDWNKMIENTMVKITGVLTLYLLFAQLK